nr:hypothetical protein [Tanacetum cinerariifolium]
MTRITTKIILRECMKKAQADCNSSLAKPKIDINAKIKLSKEHLKELRNNAYIGSEEEDAVDHIAKVLERLDSIKIPNVDTDRLHVHVFPLSFTDAARKWWINEGSDKITAWSELVGEFFCKYYPLSRASKNNVISNDDDDRPDYFEFVKGGSNNKLMDDIVSSDEEWEESDYGNPPNTDADSFLSLICMLKKKVTFV